MRHGGVVNSAEFSPDGQRVVTASQDKRARLWDATSGQAIGEPMEHENEVLSAQFSPDGQRVVTVSDSKARLWDAQTHKEIGAPIDYVVHSAEFSPDGQRLVAASYNNTAQIWDVASGKPMGKPMKHDDSVGLATQVLAISVKRCDKPLVGYLTHPEMEAIWLYQISHYGLGSVIMPCCSRCITAEVGCRKSLA
jgi:WD40 repeat protein